MTDSPSIPSKNDHTRTSSNSSLYSLALYPPPKSSNAIEFNLSQDSLDSNDSDDADATAPLLEGLISSSNTRKGHGRSFSLGGGDTSRGFTIVRGTEGQIDAVNTNLIVLDKGGGLAAGIANMSNSILGAGIIGLPYALRSAGLVSGLLLLLVLGLITDWTIRLIVLNAKLSGQRTYIDITSACFGHYGKLATSIFQFSFAFGGMCAFGVIVGDTIPNVLKAVLQPDDGSWLEWLTGRQPVIFLFTLFISYPLSLYRDIEKLSKASTLALISMTVIVLTVAIRGPTVPELWGDADQRFTILGDGLFEAIGVISFAFVCHHNSLLIYGSLRTPTLDRFAYVTHVSTALSVFASIAMSASGFLCFTDKTRGNVLNNFSDDDTIVNIARFCLGCNMVTTLPLEVFVCREVVETYFYSEEKFSIRRHWFVTTALVVATTGIALMTCDLGLVLELAGGFSASALAYCLPAACFLKLSLGKKRDRRRKVFFAWACLLFGITTLVLSTLGSLRKVLLGTGEKKVCGP